MRSWLISLLVSSSAITWVVAQQPPPVEYGVDVSYPMHHHSVSTNFDYLPHNADPENNPTPKQYQNKPIQVCQMNLIRFPGMNRHNAHKRFSIIVFVNGQPLGDRNAFHQEYLEGCRQKYKKQANRCDGGEYDRVEMCLRQPESMRVCTRRSVECEFETMTF